MLAYAQGDAAAFERLYTRHKGPLYRYLLRGCSNRATAQELFQDVWSRLIKARRRYEPTAKFSTYLFSLAHNRLVDFYRRQRFTDELPDDSAAPAASQPEAQAASQSRAERLMAEIAALPFEQREALLLKEERGLTLEQIGEVTGVGRETVKSRLRYGLAKLRLALADGT